MSKLFDRIEAPNSLHGRVTRSLALRVMEADRGSKELSFPNEAGLCEQLGVSRSILREAVRHPPHSGWLDELGRLKGGRAMGLGVARCAP